MFVLLMQTFSFPTQNGVTPLFAASQSNHGGIVTLLLSASALVDLARNVSNLCFYQTPVTIINCITTKFKLTLLATSGMLMTPPL